MLRRPLPCPIIAAVVVVFCGLPAACPGQSADSARYRSAARRFADRVLADGRDRYGEQHSPLFVDGLHAETLRPAVWKRKGQDWVLSNFASQQSLMRLLDGLTGLSGDPQYRRAAEDAARYALEHLQQPGGLLAWGGHLAWDLEQDAMVGQYADVHELKTHQPYFELMWRVDPKRARRLAEAIWAGHVLDWSRLDYNRHASVRKDGKPKWDAAFREEIEVPFPSVGGNLSFCNVTPPLIRSGAALAVLGEDRDALVWTRRLARRWQQARHPTTGLCGGQLSYRKNDRAQEALGHVHPAINEAKMVAGYHQTSRYHNLPLAQMQAAQKLRGAGGETEKLGRELIAWASDDLKTYFRQCYDADKQVFEARTIDGTRIRGEQAREGYYVPSSFAPRRPDGNLLWGCAMAWRLTRDEEHWRMLRALFSSLELGDLGSPGGEGRRLALETARADWRAIHALIDLHHATGDRAFLRLAGRLADNLLRRQAPSGLFPRARREYARTGDEAPLALLHLAAAIEGRRDAVPQPVLDARFFHCEYDGPLQEHQKKRADRRTYDNKVFFGE